MKMEIECHFTYNKHECHFSKGNSCFVSRKTVDCCRIFRQLVVVPIKDVSSDLLPVSFKALHVFC